MTILVKFILDESIIGVLKNPLLFKVKSTPKQILDSMTKFTPTNTRLNIYDHPGVSKGKL